MEYLMVGMGGFLGANARYLVTVWAAQRFGVIFPYGTLLVNVTGSFLLGLVLATLQDRVALSPPFRLFFAVGFLGGYTTFSTFTFESLRLLQEGSVWLAVTNLFGSILMGMVSVLLGFLLGRMV